MPLLSDIGARSGASSSQLTPFVKPVRFQALSLLARIFTPVVVQPVERRMRSGLVLLLWGDAKSKLSYLPAMRQDTGG